MQSRPNAIVDKKTGRIIVQTPLPKFNCLAFEGGGVACAGHAGAITELDKYKLLDDVDYVSGASGGAIAALGVALGYSSEEISNLLAAMPIDKFVQFNESWTWTPAWFASLRKALTVWYSPYFALSPHDEFLDWVRGIVEKALGDPHATMQDLEDRIAQDKQDGIKSKFKHLFVAGSNLSLETPETKMFSAETEPEIELATVVVMSAAFPFLFAPVEWKGYLWGDGGIQSILPTKVFDHERFLPKGYGFNSQGNNPGVLAVKVDTYDEIMQTQWGVKKKIEISKTSQYAWSVANATMWATSDFDEIREARTTIALPDADVDRYNLNVKQETKDRLIKEAQYTSHEFLQNYIDAAYQVKTYSSTKEWLDAQTVSDLGRMISIYRKMREDLKRDVEEQIKRKDKQEFDPNKPTLFELDVQIATLKNYQESRIKKLRKPDKDTDYIYPEKHINIPFEFSKDDWHYILKAEMGERLEVLSEKINHLEAKFQELWDEIYHRYKSKEVRLYAECDEDIAILASYYEQLNSRRDEREDLESKLGIVCEHRKQHSKKDSVDYAVLYNTLIHVEESALTSAQRAVLADSLPVIVFDEANSLRDIDFKLDVRLEHDRKLYLLAARIYLEKRSAYKGSVFEELYDKIFDNDLLVPDSYASVRKLLEDKGPDFQVSMYRLQLLLNFFEKREYPKYVPSIKVNDIFINNRYFTFWASTTTVNEDDIEMPELGERLSDETHTKDKNDKGKQEQESEGDLSSDEHQGQLTVTTKVVHHPLMRSF